MTRIRVHPSFDAYYCGFYLSGLQQALPGASFQFTLTGFPQIPKHRCLLVVVEHNGQSRRIVIDPTDGPDIRPIELGWCDLYGKANLRASDRRQADGHKIVPIGPNFGMKIWGPLQSAAIFSRTLLAGMPSAELKEHLANFRRQYKYRCAEARYSQPSTSEDDYVFHLSSLWHHNPAINENRAAFIDACRRSPGLQFEGGFAPFMDGKRDVAGFEDKFCPRRYTMQEWLDGTSRSCLVFNTPAVLDCHGWKLAEYLALGKAIISTDLTREMPAPLVHGEHIHITTPDVEHLTRAIARIREDRDYRHRLETNARRYYDTYLSPKAVATRLALAPLPYTAAHPESADLTELPLPLQSNG